SFLLPGDAFRVSRAASYGTRTVTALTRIQIADAAALDGEGGVGAGVLKAISTADAVRQERLFDHIVRLGRQSAIERIVHLLLELCERLRLVGGESRGRYAIPL